MRWLLTIFVVLPTLELVLLIYSGEHLGLLPTVTIILLTGFGGAYFAKRQGLKAWNDFRVRVATMETPGNALIDNLCIFIGGILLIIPGYITDIIGLLLLFSGPRNIIRPFIVKWIYKRMKNGNIVIM